jgi:hypothetical protein
VRKNNKSMKQAFLFSIAILFASVSIAQTQYELNMEAKKKYEASNKELMRLITKF